MHNHDLNLYVWPNSKRPANNILEKCQHPPNLLGNHQIILDFEHYTPCSTKFTARKKYSDTFSKPRDSQVDIQMLMVVWCFVKITFTFQYPASLPPTEVDVHTPAHMREQNFQWDQSINGKSPKHFLQTCCLRASSCWRYASSA